MTPSEAVRSALNFAVVAFVGEENSLCATAELLEVDLRDTGVIILEYSEDCDLRSGLEVVPSSLEELSDFSSWQQLLLNLNSGVLEALSFLTPAPCK